MNYYVNRKNGERDSIPESVAKLLIDINVLKVKAVYPQRHPQVPGAMILSYADKIEFKMEDYA